MAPEEERRRSSRKRTPTSAARDIEVARGDKCRRRTAKENRGGVRAKPAASSAGAALQELELGQQAADDQGVKRRRGRRAAAEEKAACCAVDGDGAVAAEEPDADEMMAVQEEAAMEQQLEGATKRVARPRTRDEAKADGSDWDVSFVGDPVPDDEAKRRWPDSSGEDEELKAKCHYRAAKVDDVTYELHDDVYVEAGPDTQDYIGRITEFFVGVDHGSYFTCQWFFRAGDTVISEELLKGQEHKHDCKRVFLSEEKNDNMIQCIVSKVKIVQIDPNVSLQAKVQLTSHCELYYDMSYSHAFSTFENLPAASNGVAGSEASNISSGDVDSSDKKLDPGFKPLSDAHGETKSLLDLYSGCGGMSTGLCLGAVASGIKLETRWAIDYNKDACESIKHNHPCSKVYNVKAENFLSLLKEWNALYRKYVLNKSTLESNVSQSLIDDEDESLPEDTFEVEKLIDICYGNPPGTDCDGLYFKVRWKAYDSRHDTWEPFDNLRDCGECIKEFVEIGVRENILPLPGLVDAVCGGPPCQGISGYNQFRNRDDPLKDEKNKQMIVFMDIVDYLRPKYVLMENVVDILKFADGFLGRYALSRLVAMNYQARLGMMAAGCYELPQFRMRVFLWGAIPSMVLPKFPLPTHDVVVRGAVPISFRQNLVAYDETQDRHLRKALVLKDAIYDLPKVENHQPNAVMDYSGPPQTDFQSFIRLSRVAMGDNSFDGEVVPEEGKLFDHQPLRLPDDDIERVQDIPFEKGANFRNLKGVRVGAKDTVEWDPNVPRALLRSGKPLVPDYAMSFINGKPLKPFGRLWWDETVSTVITRAEPHNHAILHPTQARVLTVRENARLQGFPDYYRLFGTIKEKYKQVGNAVAVPVARALGYCLGKAYQGGLDGKEPLFELPEPFASMNQEKVAQTSIVLTGENAKSDQVLD